MILLIQTLVLYKSFTYLLIKHCSKFAHTELNFFELSSCCRETTSCKSKWFGFSEKTKLNFGFLCNQD